MGGHKAGPGRPRGTPNKRTVQKMIEASQQVSEIEKQGQKKATAVLNDLMQTAMSFAATYQQRIIAAGPKAEKEDIELFWRAMDSAGVFAKSLAPYQQPQFKAVQVSMAPPADPGQAAKPVQGKVIQMDDPNAIARLYQQTVKRIA